MKALTGEHVSPDSFSSDLVVNYLAESIVESPDGGLHFSKLAVLSRPDLLFEIAHQLSQRLLPGTTMLCVLASSGLAVGVATALAAKLPVLYYRRKGWPREERYARPRFLPRRIFAGSVALADSHETTRFTAALCHDELMRHDVKASQILVPCSFDICNDDSVLRNMEYTSLGVISELADQVVAELDTDLSGSEFLKLISNPQTNFWIQPPRRNPSNNYWEFDAPGMSRRPKWFVGLGADAALIKRASPSLQALARWIKPDDEGIWEFFTDQDFVHDFAALTADVLAIEDYDCLLGVGHLGTSLAIALAYHNQTSFKGSICAYLGRDGIVPNPSAIKGKKILPIAMRIRSGVYPVDVHLLAEEYGAFIEDYVTVFAPDRPRNPLTRMRLTSIKRLTNLGITFWSLAD